MKRISLKPDDFECSLEECPPGFFLFDGQHVGFKSEYARQVNGKPAPEAFNQAGEYFFGQGPVIPLVPVLQETR